MPTTIPTLDPRDYTVAWFAPLEIETQVAYRMLDNVHNGRFPPSPSGDYVFRAGDACGHNIIIAFLPLGEPYGTESVGALALEVKFFFPNLSFALLVGVAAGLPNLSRDPPLDIRLGDVLVGLAMGDSPGIIAYDAEPGDDIHQTKSIITEAFNRLRLLDPDDQSAAFMPYYKPIEHLQHERGTFIDPGQDEDTLYQISEDGSELLIEREKRPDSRRTRVWYGSIGSGDSLVRNSRKRDELRDQYNLIGLEMEAVGMMSHIPAGVIRGVCDYADERKNKQWQPYAAAMAAAYAKAVLAQITPKGVGDKSGDIPRPFQPYFVPGRLREIFLIDVPEDSVEAQIAKSIPRGSPVASTGKKRSADLLSIQRPTKKPCNDDDEGDSFSETTS